MVDARKMIALFCLLFLSLPGHVWAQTSGSPDLQKVLTELNTAAAKFLSAQADFSWEQYQSVVQETDVQTGTIYFERKKGFTSTAAYLKEDNGQPAPKTIVFDGEQVKFYQPSIKQLTIMKAGANRGQWESFLTLGFGGSGTDLQANWKVNLVGMENMNGVQVAQLDLIPVQAKVLDLFSHVTIWVDPTRGINYKQVFYEPGGDKRTTTYKNIRYNEKISGDVFVIKPAPNTSTVVK
jgi:outer membrane lipoprotein-sorting protein